MFAAEFAEEMLSECTT